MAVPSHSYAADLALATRIAQGDAAAADEFAGHYSERFTYLAGRAGVPRQDCEDVAQEALLAALQQLRRGLFRGDCRLGSWLTHILRGKVSDYWRGRPGATMMAAELAAADHLPAPLSDHELNAIVREALAQLPPQHRIILLLNRTAGFTLAEISRKLELSVGQVSGKLYAAEEMFRDHLRGEAPRVKRKPRRAPAVLLPASADEMPAARRQGRRLCLNIPQLFSRSNAPRRQWAGC